MNMSEDVMILLTEVSYNSVFRRLAADSGAYFGISSSMRLM